MIRLSAVILSIGLLVGCSTKPREVKKETVHPNWPVQIKSYDEAKLSWQVKVIDGKEILGQRAENNQLRHKGNYDRKLSGKLRQFIFNLQQHVPLLLMHIQAGHGM